MKAKSREIRNILDKEPFINLRDVQKKILDLNIPTEHNEYTIDEAVVDLEYIRDILIKSIDKEILDNYNFQSRVSILNYLTQIRDNINSIVQGNQNLVPTLLDLIQNTKNYVFTTSNLDPRIRGLFDYEKKFNELKGLHEEYNRILVEIERAKGIYEKTKEQTQIINENYQKTQQLLNQSIDLDNQMQQKNRTSADITSQIQNRFDQVNSHSAKISEFSTTIDSQKEELSKSNEKINNLIKKNEELEGKVVELLSSAVGGTLGKTFGDRKAELKKSEFFWKGATFISIIILFGAAGAVFYELYTGVSETTLLFSKISLLIPASVAVWFTSSNYNRERKLLEEYAFKSTIALSLDSYRKVLNEELDDGERSKISEFLISTMQKIYSSPLENIAKHSPKGDDEIQISLLEKIVNVLGISK